MSGTLERFQELLGELYSAGGSDLHLVAGQAPRLRLDQGLVARGEPFRADELAELARELFGARGLARQEERGVVRRSLALTRAPSCLARVSLASSCGDYSLSARLLAAGAVSLTPEEIGIPPVVTEQLLARPHGLWLISGAHGSGKTTALWGLLGWLLRTQPLHVCTVEDPIGLLFAAAQPQALGLIQQREVGTDVPDVAAGIAAAMDQDLDVLGVTDLRDLDGLMAALHAAETGHLVLAQVHARSAAEALVRIVEAAPETLQGSVRRTLSDVLGGVLWQRLLPRLPRGRVAAYEVLLPDDALRATLLRGGHLHELRGGPGSVPLRAQLEALEQAGTIGPEAAAEARREAELG